MHASGGTRGAPDSTALTSYVKAYLEKTGESERGLARRARDPETGIGVSHGWIGDIVDGSMDRAPDLRRLRALAAGMGVDVGVLTRLAAAQWLGIPVEEVQTPEGDVVIVTVPPGLSQEERKKFRRMVEEMAKHL